MKRSNSLSSTKAMRRTYRVYEQQRIETINRSTERYVDETTRTIAEKRMENEHVISRESKLNSAFVRQWTLSKRYLKPDIRYVQARVRLDYRSRGGSRGFSKKFLQCLETSSLLSTCSLARSKIKLSFAFPCLLRSGRQTFFLPGLFLPRDRPILIT